MSQINMARIKRMSAGHIVLMAAVLSAVVCILLSGGIYLLRTVTDPDADLWSMFEGLSSAAAFSVAVGGGLMVLAQLTEAVDSRSLTIFNDVFDRLACDRNIEARRWIYQNLPDNPERGLASLSDEGREHVKLVLNSFDHLGFLVRQDWVSSEAEEAIIQWVSPFVAKTWIKLGPYVEYEVAQRPEEPDYYIAACHLAERCIAYRKALLRHDPTITWRRDAL
ncbi:MAG: hypothetical protein JXB07_15675 [Anaerolineae bacterium]|nr:hypothetical protein [Anaerolineae bacterium]